MNFDFNEEQRLLQDSVQRLLSDQYDFETRQRASASDDGFSSQLWQKFAELGLTALPFAEEDGGIGGGGEEIMIVMEALGGALSVEPYLPSVVIASSVLHHGATAAQRASLVPAICEGALRFAFAHTEPSSGYQLAHVSTTAKRVGETYVLDGAKTLVIHGGSAGKLIVSARVQGATMDPDGIGLFIVDAAASGVTRHAYATQDGMRAAEITLSGVCVSQDALLGGSTNAFGVIQRVCDEAIAALCAEAVGAMDVAVSSTVAYLKTRKQFGRAIGEFQALQHKASEMVVELEQARSMAMYATMMARSHDAESRTLATSAAKIQISRSAQFIGQTCVQLHGGVGMTMEYQIGHYFKRLTMIEKAFGDTDYHRDQLSKARSILS
jgi:pimeloyl-CoA dehydrogenase small subunit